MLRFDGLRYQSARTGRTKWAVFTPAIAVIGAAIAVGGCSTDFLRFDSPEFGLNGDKTAIREPEADTLYEQRTAAVPVSGGEIKTARVASARDASARAPSVRAPSVSRSSEPTTSYQLADRKGLDPQRIASVAPVAKTATPEPIGSATPDRDGYAPVTTGALPAKQSIVVQPGDTLYQLSRRHGVTVTALQQANGLSGNVIRPGQTLVVPGAGRAGDQSRRAQRQAPRFASAPSESAPVYQPNRIQYRAPQNDPSSAGRSVGESVGQVYTIRPGDSLYAISRRTGVSVAELKRLNAITNVRALRPGARLSLGGEMRRGVEQPPVTTKVASRIDDNREPKIKAKTIRTVPITQSKSAADNPNGSIRQPRILNQRPATPIATKPKQQVAAAPSANPELKFRWPARGRIIAPFNHSGEGVKNDGVNIALPMGTEIGAADGGVVAYAGSELKGYGNLVLVRHDNGWVSAYAHASEILVKRGDRINRGQIIAKAGRSGDVTQPQLHFELRKGAKPVDPMPHMAEM